MTSIEDHSNYKYCITLWRNGTSFSVYMKDLQSKDNLMQGLSQFCILSEFEHRYTIIELLGKGSMGEVKLPADLGLQDQKAEDWRVPRCQGFLC